MTFISRRDLLKRAAVVGAAVILGLGCEVNQIEHYLGPNAPKSGRLVGMTLQETGGTRATVEAARKAIHAQMEKLSAEKRVPVSASKMPFSSNKAKASLDKTSAHL